MTKEEVFTLLESCHTAKEWNSACDRIKRTCGGYPEYWWPDVKLSGMMDRIMARWGSDSKIRVTNVPR